MNFNFDQVNDVKPAVCNYYIFFAIPAQNNFFYSNLFGAPCYVRASVLLKRQTLNFVQELTSS